MSLNPSELVRNTAMGYRDMVNYLLDNPGRDLGLVLTHGVKEGFWPFQPPGEVTFYYEEILSDWNRVKFVIEFRDYEELKIVWYLDRNEFYSPADDREWALQPAQKIRDYYRYRPTLPVPDTIELGEN